MHVYITIHVTNSMSTLHVVPDLILLHAPKRKPGRQIRVNSVLLIGENGSNLGVMDWETALQLADSKGIQMIQVHKETPKSEAIFGLVSCKQLWDDENRKKQAQKTQGMLPRRLLSL